VHNNYIVPCYSWLYLYREILLIFLQLAFFRFIYETERHNGVAELLEVLGRFVYYLQILLFIQTICPK